MCGFSSGICSRMCFSDADCHAGAKCLNSACPSNLKEIVARKAKMLERAEAKTSNKKCRSNDDCSYSQDCFLGRCAKHCESDADCKDSKGTKCKFFSQGAKYTS